MARHFQIDPLDPSKLINVNKLKEVTNPIPFARNGVTTPDGLLSNEIFGITKYDRSSTYAYIDLSEDFMHPLFYKIWSRMDSKIKAVIHETDEFTINSKGELVVDNSGNGGTGIKWLKKNIDKITIKSTGSSKRDVNIRLLKEKRDLMFINKFIIIPAYYRDVNTENDRIGIGDINKLYQSLMIAVKSLKESADYGLTLSGATRGRIQELILTIYNWFGDEPNIPKKFGILRRANLSKTTDYSSRLVLSAPNLKVEKMEDLMVDFDHSAVPLASICTDFYPLMIFHIRRFFENEFSGNPTYYAYDKNGNLIKIHVKDYQIAFSDDRIKKELDRFQHGYSNRFIPIEVPNEEGKKVYMQFKGYNMTKEEYAKKTPGTVPLLHRDLTWCDVIFLAALEATKDKTILITRYPIDSYFNQFPTMITVNSTKETEPMIVNDKYIKYYPKIRQEDIGKDTSNLFVDTLNICNCYLGGICGDYKL